MRFDRPAPEKEIDEAVREQLRQLERLLQLGNRIAGELGFTPGRLELNIRPSVGELAYKLRVDGQWFDLPRGLHKRSEDRIEALLRRVLAGQPVVLDHSELIEALDKARGKVEELRPKRPMAYWRKP